MKMKASYVIGSLGVLLILLACAGPGGPAYREVSPAGFSPGSAIPAPSGPVVLTITGDIGVTNVEDTLQLDMPALESLGLVEYTLDDPFIPREITYTGVLLSELSRYVQPSAGARNFRVQALDDYQVDLSLDDIRRWPILLATRTDGRHMEIDNFGPTRVVFPYHAHRELDPVEYDKLWIWNVSHMEVN